MRLWEILSESPERIDSIFSDYNNPNENKRCVKDLFQDPMIKISKFGDYTLWKNDHNYALINDNTKWLAFISKFGEDNAVETIFRNLGTVVQYKVWRDKSIPETKNMTQLIFTKLIDEFGSITTDSSQTQYGEQMWDRKVRDTLTNNSYYVYYVDLQAKEKLRIKSVNDFNNILNNKQPYGRDDPATATAYSNRRFIISKRRIK